MMLGALSDVRASIAHLRRAMYRAHRAASLPGTKPGERRKLLRELAQLRAAVARLESLWSNNGEAAA
jgi:hypothetical protein